MGLIFDGVDLEETYGFLINGVSTWQKPQRDRSLVHVAGRNGDLIFDNGCWQNVTVTYEFCIRSDFKNKFEDFAAWMCSHLGYYRLEDPVRHPDVFRMAEFSGSLDPELWFTTDDGVFELEFNCKPQQWLLSGENPIELGTGAAVLGGYRGDGSGTATTWYVQSDPDNVTVVSSPLFNASSLDTTNYLYYMKIDYIGSAATVTYNFSYAEYNANKVVQAVMGNEVTRSTSTFPQLGAIFQSNYTYQRFSIYSPDLDDLKISLIKTDGNGNTVLTIPVWNYDEKTVTNPTGYESRPLISIENTALSMAVLNINDYTVALDDQANTKVYIDCELEDCYSISGGSTVNANSLITITNSDERELSDFPYFTSGSNTMFIKGVFVARSYVEDFDEAGDAAPITILPRWYRI